MTYLHGGNIKEVANKFGIEESAIIDFSANINPLGFSPLAREAIIGAINGVINYPDNQSSALVHALSNYHSIAAENILTGNGATELIYLIPKALKPEKALIVAPAFSEYERALKLAGCKADHFVLVEKNNFSIDTAHLYTVMKKGYDMLWLASPSNPGGSLTPKKVIIEIAHKAAETGITLVVDEAFIDYCEEESIKNEIHNFDRLIVLRSMTKFFALAGLRIGYLFGHDRIISTLKQYKEPWSLNFMGEAAAVASISDKEYIEKSLAFIAGERTFLLKELQNIKGIETCKPAANYILIRLNNEMSAHSLQERLLKEHHILIRDCGNYKGLGGKFIRVAVRRRGDNERLVKGLKNTLFSKEG
ncbi:MAG: threonine-phosphate decarboxylase CobD [bacterium]|nr:threonine-phosphate decarboxylase CobD [bacterium]